MMAVCSLPVPAPADLDVVRDSYDRVVSSPMRSAEWALCSTSGADQAR
jgi:hypothetical protein